MVIALYWPYVGGISIKQIVFTEQDNNNLRRNIFLTGLNIANLIQKHLIGNPKQKKQLTQGKIVNIPAVSKCFWLQQESIHRVALRIRNQNYTDLLQH